MYSNQITAPTGQPGLSGSTQRLSGNDAQRSTGSWYVALTRAWGSAVDSQAARIVSMSESLGNGNDSPGAALMVAAQSHRLSFMATAASTANNSIGQALESLGRKQ